MNKINLKSVIVTVVTISLSVLSYGQHNHNLMNMNHQKMMEHKNITVMSVKLNDSNLNKAYIHYTMIKDALYNADTKKVQMLSNMLVGILNTYGKAPDATDIADKLAKAAKIENQRTLFANLSTAFEPLLKNNVSKGAIYKNFCPMANGSGAYWYSNSEKIVNPYFGEAMPSCGSVKDTYKSI